MKPKELKALAKKIADVENQLAECHDLTERRTLEDIIFKLTNKVTDFEDMMTLDELIQEYIKN